MKVVLNLTGSEIVELVNATKGTTFALQVKAATLKAEMKELKAAIALTETVQAVALENAIIAK